MSRDPIGYEGGYNLYEYVGSNPVGFVDPDGHSPAAIGLVSGGAGAMGGLSGAGLVASYLWSLQNAWEFSSGNYLPDAFDFCFLNNSACITEDFYDLFPVGEINHCESRNGKEHTKNKRPSSLEKHEKGRSRVSKDQGGEKGDIRRRAKRIRPKGHKGPYPLPSTS